MKKNKREIPKTFPFILCFAEAKIRQLHHQMSRNGKLCLQQLILPYGLINGNNGARHALAREIPQFKKQFPSVRISVRPRIWPEQTITGVYSDGSHLSLDINRLSAQAILAKAHMLVHTANDEVRYFNAQTRVLERKSVQGAWNPWLWITDYAEPRYATPKWDRKLTNQEWSHYVKKYATSWEWEERAVRDGIAQTSDLHVQYTQEVQKRWDDNVTKNLPSDVEGNIAEMKKRAAKRVYAEPPTHDEYVLFSTPDLRQMGNEAISMLRRKQAVKLVQWWDKRREQLKPP